MVKVNNSDSKITPPKKRITITDVTIDGDIFADEDGNIIERLIDELPDGAKTKFDIKITIDLPMNDNNSE